MAHNSKPKGCTEKLLIPLEYHDIVDFKKYRDDVCSPRILKIWAPKYHHINHLSDLINLLFFLMICI